MEERNTTKKILHLACCMENMNGQLKTLIKAAEELNEKIAILEHRCTVTQKTTIKLQCESLERSISESSLNYSNKSMPDIDKWN
jgi:hypothetical protein